MWGLSEPGFLALYGVALAVATIVALLDRRRRVRAGDTPPAGDPSAPLDPYEAMLLLSGSRAVGASAVKNLQAGGHVVLQGGQGWVAQRPPARDAHPVEQAVYWAIENHPPGSGSGARRRRAFERAAERALRPRLEQLGLARTREQQALPAPIARWFLPVVFVGLGALVSGVAGRPRVALVGLLLGAFINGMVSARLPLATKAGSAAAARRSGQIQAAEEARELGLRPDGDPGDRR